MKILVVGLGTVGSRLVSYDGFEGIHHNEFNDDLSGYTAVVNCAALAGSGKCSSDYYDKVMEANVRFPLRMYKACARYGIPFIHFSTSGVYGDQVAVEPSYVGLKEIDFVYPHNLYCGSKLLSESVLLSSYEEKCPLFIFRLPWLVIPSQYVSRANVWDLVQGTYTSVLEVKMLADACVGVVGSMKSGVYNVASDVVWFPSFFREMTGVSKRVRYDAEKNMTSACPIDNSKFEETFNVFR